MGGWSRRGCQHGPHPGGHSVVPARRRGVPNPRVPKGTPGRQLEFLPSPKTAPETAENLGSVNWLIY